jgi:mannose-6-phosphate isomerase
MERLQDKLIPVKGKVQHYAWGGDSYLPGLLKIPPKKGETYAEYWLGAHPGGSAELLYGGQERILLKDYIRAFPEETLGTEVQQQFGTLPYLLKVLDVKQMLSIQVHPSRENARRAFEAENRLGIPLSAPERNYKDDNHKPELMLALSPFWLLHGFKPVPALQVILQQTPELRFLLPLFGNGDYKALYREVMEMPQAEVNEKLGPLLARILPLYHAAGLEKQQEDFWAARAALTYRQQENIDRGIFSIYFFNLLEVQPGGAVFQDAGLPHAYLEGQNVEIMANSDNVLRGGLTPKHVDVPELMKHLKFEATVPRLISGQTVDAATKVFPTPAPDFELGRICLPEGQALPLVSRSVQLFMVLEGAVEIQEQDPAGRRRYRSFRIPAGGSWVSFHQAHSLLRALEDAVVYRGSVGEKLTVDG